MSRITATYRLQLTPAFGFADAAGLVPYLRDLGVSHLYLSPVFEARAGSEHGYDGTDPRRLRAELGGREGFAVLSNAARSAGMGLVLDVVPNHMAADTDNPFWCDVLRHGRMSSWADMFEIDWDAGGGRIVLPVLAATLETLLGDGRLTVEDGDADEAASWLVVDGGLRLPLCPESATEAAAAKPDLSPETLGRLLARQHYEPAFWRDGLRRLNYRRFFDVAELAGVRVEDERILRVTHEGLVGLVAEGAVDAVRVDHVDGLRAPGAYLNALRDMLQAASPGRDVPILVEKILQPGEPLPPWPVAGTTGYEHLRESARLFVDAAGYARLELQAATRLGLDTDFAALVLDAKREALTTLLGAEVARLAALAGDPVVEAATLHEAIVEVSAALPVYRTYLEATPPRPADRERIARALADADARLGSGHGGIAILRGLLDPDRPDGETFRAAWQQVTGAAMAKGLEDIALYRHVVLTSLNEVGGGPEIPEDPVRAWHDAQAERADRWPHEMIATATHDSKRGEDTRARISVLSEFADQWTAAVDRWLAWHAGGRRRTGDGWSPCRREEVLFYQTLLGVWPWDGVLDDDLAGRLGDYLVKAAREARTHTSWRKPDEEHELGLRQFAERIALRGEGERFRADATDLRRKAAFHGAVNGLAQTVLRLTAPGVPDCYQGAELWSHVLVDPDNRRPVDFEHRRALLAALHQEHGPEGLRQRAELLARWSDGRIKLWTIASLLRLRRERRGVFDVGSYLPITTAGTHAHRVVAYARTDGARWTLAVVPRLTARLVPVGQWPVGRSVWQDTRIELPAGAPRNLADWLTGASVRAGDGVLSVGDVLHALPFAVLNDT